MRTAWGYEVTGGTVGSIITVEQFNTMTGGAYAGNPRIESALSAASQAVRNYCGWHIAPSMTCTAHPEGGSFVTRLPAAYVSSITEVKEGTEELTDYEWRDDGLLKRCRRWSEKWNSLTVKYAAGYDVAAVPDLAEAVCSIAAGVLSVSAGVTSESADGVTISYRQDAASIAAALTSQQKSALEPYKVVSSHAA